MRNIKKRSLKTTPEVYVAYVEELFDSQVNITEEENWIVATDKKTNVASQGKAIQEALDNLKEALELFYEEKKTIKEASSYMGITEDEFAKLL